MAIKRPHFGVAPEHEVTSRFLDEARLLAHIHHANVVGIHQIGQDDHRHFLVLDYVEGGALDELCWRALLRRRKLPPPIVLRIIADVLAGLHAVHEAADVDGKPLAMVHRDVATQNVLVGRDGVTRLADFGIAKATTSSTVTDKAYLHGRLQYMAPEYLRREPTDRRLDVYATGVTMWAALAGDIPWADLAEAHVVHELLRGGAFAGVGGVTLAPPIRRSCRGRAIGICCVATGRRGRCSTRSRSWGDTRGGSRRTRRWRRWWRTTSARTWRSGGRRSRGGCRCRTGCRRRRTARC
ncbi:MAG: serine/threonine-protein kinase [Polyangiaceae bacterium]